MSLAVCDAQSLTLHKRHVMQHWASMSLRLLSSSPAQHPGTWTSFAWPSAVDDLQMTLRVTPWHPGTWIVGPWREVVVHCWSRLRLRSPSTWHCTVWSVLVCRQSVTASSRGQRAVQCGQRAVQCGQWALQCGQWTVQCGQRAVQWSWWLRMAGVATWVPCVHSVSSASATFISHMTARYNSISLGAGAGIPQLTILSSPSNPPDPPRCCYISIIIVIIGIELALSSSESKVNHTRTRTHAHTQSFVHSYPLITSHDDRTHQVQWKYALLLRISNGHFLVGSCRRPSWSPPFALICIPTAARSGIPSYYCWPSLVSGCCICHLELVTSSCPVLGYFVCLLPSK